MESHTYSPTVRHIEGKLSQESLSLPAIGELDRMEKEHTLWDWFSEGLGSSVLCEKREKKKQTAYSKGDKKTSVSKKISLECLG